MEKQIMIYAYCKYNLGDDLFIKLLCNRYPHVKFFLHAPKGYRQLFKDNSNLKIIRNDRFLLRLLRFTLRKLGFNSALSRPYVAKKCDAAIYIGGSLFIQNKNWEGQLKENKKKEIPNKPFYLLGANFGPFKDRVYYLKYKELFSRYTDICFRDKYSFELFRELPNVRIADDVVFQLKVNLSQKEVKKRNVVISVIKPSRKQLPNFDEIYFKKIREIIIYLCNKDYNITLMSFCKKEGDELAISEILNLLPKEYLTKVDSYYYNYNFKEALSIINKSCFVIATRFHSMILGWINKKPVYPIVYSKKMENVINDINFKGLYTVFSNLIHLKPENVYQGMKINYIDVSKQVESSEKHFKNLDVFLN